MHYLRSSSTLIYMASLPLPGGTDDCHSCSEFGAWLPFNRFDLLGLVLFSAWFWSLFY